MPETPLRFGSQTSVRIIMTMLVLRISYREWRITLIIKGLIRRFPDNLQIHPTLAHRTHRLTYISSGEAAETVFRSYS